MRTGGFGGPCGVRGASGVGGVVGVCGVFGVRGLPGETKQGSAGSVGSARSPGSSGKERIPAPPFDPSKKNKPGPAQVRLDGPAQVANAMAVAEERSAGSAAPVASGREVPGGFGQGANPGPPRLILPKNKPCPAQVRLDATDAANAVAVAEERARASSPAESAGSAGCVAFAAEGALTVVTTKPSPAGGGRDLLDIELTGPKANEVLVPATPSNAPPVAQRSAGSAGSAVIESCPEPAGGADLDTVFRPSVLEEDMWENNKRAIDAQKTNAAIRVPCLDKVNLLTNPCWLAYGYDVNDDAFAGGWKQDDDGNHVRVDTCPGEGTSQGRGSLGQEGGGGPGCGVARRGRANLGADSAGLVGRGPSGSGAGGGPMTLSFYWCFRGPRGAPAVTPTSSLMPVLSCRWWPR